MSKKLSPKTLALVTVLAGASVAMSAADIASAAPGEFKDTTACLSALHGARLVGLVASNKAAGAPVTWEITDLGRAAFLSGEAPPRAASAQRATGHKKASKKPAGKKAAQRKQPAAPEERDIPRYTPGVVADEPAAEVEAAADEPEIDFALWASGVLTVQVGDNTHLIPRAHVERLRDYLVSHLPRKAAEPPKLKSEIYVGSLLGAPLGSGVVGSILSDVSLSNPTPEPWFDFAKHLVRQRAFSERTFGPGRRVDMVCDHITKELIEVRESNGHLTEWIDVVILGLDGCLRSGASPTEVIFALLCKQTDNELRQWPDWRTADPDKAIEHNRSGEKATPAAPTVDGGKFSDFHDQQTRDGVSALSPVPLPPIPPGGYANAEPVAQTSVGA